jgi:hypothetical protein
MSEQKKKPTTERLAEALSPERASSMRKRGKLTNGHRARMDARPSASLCRMSGAMHKRRGRDERTKGRFNRLASTERGTSEARECLARLHQGDSAIHLRRCSTMHQAARSCGRVGHCAGGEEMSLSDSIIIHIIAGEVIVVLLFCAMALGKYLAKR